MKQAAARMRKLRRHWLTAIGVVAAASISLVVAQSQRASESMSQRVNEFLPPPLETRVLGQNTWLLGSRASLRVITLDHQKNQPIAVSRITLTLTPAHLPTRSPAHPLTLVSGRTNKRGTLDASFRVPNLPKGSYQLIVTADTPLGKDEVKSTVTITESAQVLLTTDKPLYQPAQVIHMRALCLMKPDLKTAAGRPLTFEIEDPKGNKVFKKTVETSQFGIASADFQLADEINLGTYTVRANLMTNEPMTNDQPSAISHQPSALAVAEQKVNVERYVLPKFKVVLNTDKKFYMPGETVKGTVQADYFFGKPVSGGEVNIKLSTFDVGWRDFAEVMGKTDEGGAFKFEKELPTYFAGLPLEQGNALLKIEVRVTDKAEHQERTVQTYPVAKDAIRIAVVPESGNVVANVENAFYVITTYPDGTPAKCRFELRGADFAYPGQTDANGIGEVKLTPRTGQLNITVSAQDEQGNKGETKQALSYQVSEESVMLRTSKAIAKVGESLRLDVITHSSSFPVSQFPGRGGGVVYVDVIKERQTMLTKSLDLERNRASMTLPLTEGMAGTLVLHAYRITRDGQIVRDTKVVYVNPASDLNIKVTARKLGNRETGKLGNQETEALGSYPVSQFPSFLPGEKARLDFSVTDAGGHPVLAALGVSIVDESVFALQEMQPGLEKVYFLLEKELLKPRYEIHGGFEPLQLLREEPKPEPVPLDASKQKAARVLFAAAAPMVEFGINVNTWEQRWEMARQKWQEHANKAAEKIWRALHDYRKRKGEFPKPYEVLDELISEKLLTLADIKDPLGNRYQVKAAYRNDLRYGIQLVSAGPDGKMDTLDDVIGYPWAGRGDRVLRRAMRGGGFGGGGGMPGGGPVPEVFEMEERMLAAKPVAKLAAAPADSPAAEPVRIRQFFPETLFFAPQVLTDERGKASVDLTMADSITTWRLTALGNSVTGKLGSTTAPIRVFQDFFVDIDLPVSLTQNDEVSIPVAVYNYLPQPQTVRLRLQISDFGTQPSGGAQKSEIRNPKSQESWFELLDSPEKTVRMNAGDVGVVYFRLRVKGIGMHSLTVFAYGEKMSDAIKRSIEVVPDGKEVWKTVNDRLEGDVQNTITIPQGAIDGASNIIVKVYPGAFTQVIEGLDKLLRMPFG